MTERLRKAEEVPVSQGAETRGHEISAEAQSVIERVGPIIERQRAALYTPGGKLRTGAAGEKAQDRAHELYAQVVALITQAPIAPIERADLLLRTSELMTEHLDPEARSVIERDLHIDQLPDVLGRSLYRTISRELATALQDGPIETDDDHTVPEQLENLSSLPPAVRAAVIRRFEAFGLISRNVDDEAGTSIIFGANKKAAERLRTGAVETAHLAHKIFVADVKPTLATSLDEVETTYDAHDTKSAISTVELKSETRRAKILPINELRLGHQDAADGIRLVRETIDLINGLSEEEKPNVILVTNLIQGEFAHLQSKRRASLAEGMATNDAQFNAAKLLLDELRATGIPVVLSLGRDDQRIAEDNAVDVVRELAKLTKSGGKDDFIPYYEINKATQDTQYQKHRKFQLEYALPLSYVLGRGLRSAEQVTADTDGMVTTSEVVALYAHVVHGEPLPAELGINPELLVGLGEWREGICVVNDTNLTISTEEQDMNVWYRHSFSGFTPETLLQNHMGAVLGALGAMGTNGEWLPDAVMTGGSQEGVYATRSGAGGISLPGLTNPGRAMGRSQGYTAVQGDPSRRMNLLRKRPSAPAIETYEQRDTGEIVLSYINKDLMERADSLPRMAVIELCDFQIGSPTARPDYQIKYLSYILELAKEMPIAIQFAGDIIHGNIYPGFADESQAIGLIKIESQKQMVSSMLKKAFWNVPQSLLDSVVDVLVQQGNHDEIQKKRTPNNHDTNIDYIVRDFERILDDTDDPETKRVRHNSIFRTETGVPVPTWMGRSMYGDYNVLTAHYHVMRGMKGDTGGLPVYHSYARAVGLGAEEQANVLMGAHWHNPQSAVLGNKLVVVGGAMAEQSQFEDMLGYSARLSGTIVFLGGGKPPEVMSVTPEALNNHGVRHGWFTPDNLADNGFHDDPDFDVWKHGPYSPDYLPKSGLQKALRVLARNASQLTDFEAPHSADFERGQISPQTQRMLARVATQ